MSIISKVRIIAATATYCFFSVPVILCFNTHWDKVRGKELLDLFIETRMLFLFSGLGLISAVFYIAAVYDEKRRRGREGNEKEQRG